MEEKKETASKLTYEQLEQAAMQLQQRLIIAESKLKNIDLASVRLNWLFEVLKNKESFSKYFVQKCTEEIESILTIDEETDNEQKEEVD